LLSGGSQKNENWVVERERERERESEFCRKIFYGPQNPSWSRVRVRYKSDVSYIDTSIWTSKSVAYFRRPSFPLQGNNIHARDHFVVPDRERDWRDGKGTPDFCSGSTREHRRIFGSLVRILSNSTGFRRVNNNV
jgi:hypothetical protein